jgi:hypothetical protein
VRLLAAARSRGASVPAALSWHAIESARAAEALV